MLTQDQLNQLERLNMPMDKRISGIIDDHVEDAINQHNKVYTLRMDIHTPNDTSNATISKFNQRFIQEEKRKGYDPSYVMVHEISKSGNSHYHAIYFYNGNKTQSTYPHFETANRILNNVCHLPQDQHSGWIDSCDHNGSNGMMIYRDDYGSLNDVTRQASYLAKLEQKEAFEPGTRKVFSSRLKGKKKNSSK